MSNSLRGLFVSVHVPSEDLLMVNIDCSNLSPQVYMSMIYELQDVITTMDLEYAKGRIKGRSIRARYKRVIEYNVRRRILRFFPYPSYFQNRLKTIRAKVYECLNEYSISLQYMRYGFFKGKIYIIPLNLFDSFMNKIAELNNELLSLIESMRNVEITPVIRVMYRYGFDISYSISKAISSFSYRMITVDFIPVDFKWFSDMMTEKIVDIKVKEMINEKSREIVEGVISELKRKLEPIIRAMEGEIKIKKMKKRLMDLKNLADGLGLKAISETVITPLINVIENPEKASEVFGERKISEWIDSRIKTIL